MITHFTIRYRSFVWYLIVAFTGVTLVIAGIFLTIGLLILFVSVTGYYGQLEKTPSYFTDVYLIMIVLGIGSAISGIPTLLVSIFKSPAVVESAPASDFGVLINFPCNLLGIKIS